MHAATIHDAVVDQEHCGECVVAFTTDFEVHPSVIAVQGTGEEGLLPPRCHTEPEFLWYVRELLCSPSSEVNPSEVAVQSSGEDSCCHQDVIPKQKLCGAYVDYVRTVAFFRGASLLRTIYP